MRTAIKIAVVATWPIWIVPFLIGVLSVVVWAIVSDVIDREERECP